MTKILRFTSSQIRLEIHIPAIRRLLGIVTSKIVIVIALTQKDGVPVKALTEHAQT